MILLSVGTQLPFDRLVRSVDEWAFQNKRSDVVAQIGETDLTPRNMTCFDFLDPERFSQYQREADVLIAHAGMGSIITAMELGKPLIAMPRSSSQGEHRNDHQFGTARRFAKSPGIYIAQDEAELRSLLDRIDELSAGVSISKAAPSSFAERLDDYIAVHGTRSSTLRAFVRRLLKRKRPGLKQEQR